LSTDATVTTAEDTPYVFQVGDFGFSDPVEGDALQAGLAKSLLEFGEQLAPNALPLKFRQNGHM